MPWNEPVNLLQYCDLVICLRNFIVYCYNYSQSKEKPSFAGHYLAMRGKLLCWRLYRQEVSMQVHVHDACRCVYTHTHTHPLTHPWGNAHAHKYICHYTNKEQASNDPCTLVCTHSKWAKTANFSQTSESSSCHFLCASLLE